MPDSPVGTSSPNLPPLECLRYFEIAARHESFTKAAREIGVTAAAVAYRVKELEKHLGRALFDRHRRSVTLTARGKACLRDVQRVLTDISGINERYGSRRTPRRLNIAVVESVADRWLMPRLPSFRALKPDIAIDIATDLGAADAESPDVDLWITYAGEPGGPAAPEAQHETLFEETLFPVCSPALLEARSRPGRATDLHGWPLLYHLKRPSDWAHWFAAQETVAPDLNHASGFGLSSMLVQAAKKSMGAAIGRPSTIGRELQQGSLVALFDRDTGPRTSCCLVSSPAARSRPEVRAFRDWILEEAASHRRAPASAAS